jgi:hypothetical protein
MLIEIIEKHLKLKTLIPILYISFTFLRTNPKKTFYQIIYCLLQKKYLGSLNFYFKKKKLNIRY